MSSSHEPAREAGRRWLPPWWTAAFPLLVALGIAAWRAAVAETGTAGAFASGLLWPGLGAFAVVSLIVWLGWVLDID